MENQHDDSSDNDKRMMNSFERYSDDTKEKKKKAKKKRQQQDDQEKRKSDERRTEEAKKDEARRPSLLDALIKAEPVLAKKEGVKKKQSKDAQAEETEAAAESEQKPELSKEERRAAAEEYIARRQEQLDAEAAEQPDEAAVTQANRTFLQRLADRLRDSAASPDDELLQGVTDETVAELHAATNDETGGVGQPDREAVSSGEANQQPYEDDYMVVVEQDDNEHLHRSKKPPVVPPPIAPNIIDAATLASGNHAAEPTSGFGDRPSGNRLSRLGARSERVSSDSTETPNSTEVRDGKKHSGGGEFLLGAFVGYLFGRRRGRITAELEQVPERQKLEKEVRQLQTTIEQYEGKVRSAVAHGLEVTPQRNEQRDVRPAAEAKFTAESFVPSVPRAEQNTEAPSTTAEAGQASAEQTKTAEPIAPERIRTMPLTEVLREAGQVDYRGTSLKGLYEQGFLNEARLRETMRLYLAGERYEQRLEQHIRASAELEPRRSYEQERELSQVAEHENDSSTGVSAVPIDEIKTTSQSSVPAAANEQPASSRISPTQQTSGRGRSFDASAIKQASIGAAIGIVFVTVVIIALSLR